MHISTSPIFFYWLETTKNTTISTFNTKKIRNLQFPSLITDFNFRLSSGNNNFFAAFPLCFNFFMPFFHTFCVKGILKNPISQTDTSFLSETSCCSIWSSAPSRSHLFFVFLLSWSLPKLDSDWFKIALIFRFMADDVRLYALTPSTDRWPVVSWITCSGTPLW